MQSPNYESAVDGSTSALRAVISAHTLADDDFTASNTWDEPDLIGLAANESAVSTDGVVTVRLPPVSWAAVLLG